MERDRPLWRTLLRGVLALAGSSAITLALFLVLPLMQTIGRAPAHDLLVRDLGAAQLPPPPPPPPEEQPEEEPPPEPRPELAESFEPLDLSQLELALAPVAGDALFGDFTVRLPTVVANGTSEALDEIVTAAELDQRPRVIFQKMPTYPPDLRARQGSVYVLFLVDRQGRVVEPRVERSTNPGFERAALEAVRQWRFEPGTRKGEKVQFKMRVPITFNAS